MSGPRILLAVVLAAMLLVWLALATGKDSDLERGLAQTEEAIALVEAELVALDPAYQALRAQGLVLGLREQHDRIRTLLAQHKDRRVQIRTDPTLDPRQRLPLLRELVEQIDETLAIAVQLRRTLDAIVGFRRDAVPILEEARHLRDELDRVDPPPDDAWGARRATLGSSLADLDQRVEMADRLLRENTEQGRRLGEAALAALRTLLDEQRQLLAAAGR
jgi:hypothetical protein